MYDEKHKQGHDNHVHDMWRLINVENKIDFKS